MKWANVLKESSKKISLNPNTASHNNISWYIDTDGFLEHSPREGCLYYKGPALRKIIWVPPHKTKHCYVLNVTLKRGKMQAIKKVEKVFAAHISQRLILRIHKPKTLYYLLCMLQISYCSTYIPIISQKYQSNC